MAEIKCTLGGRERAFKYTRKDRAEYEKRFSAGMWETIRKNVLALDEDGEPTAGGMVEPQHALVWIGLRHNGPKVTEDAVSGWLDDEAGKGSNVFAIYTAATAAVLASGVLGYTFIPPVEDDEEADPNAPADAKAE